MSKEIELTQGYVAIVDDDMYDELIAYKWSAHRMTRGNRTVYATRLQRMHHVVLGFPPPGMVIDHINGNGLDNRRENLRFASIGENSMCRKRDQSNNTSGYRGVSWHKAKQRWEAKITINGRRVYLGRFVNKDDAARAYDKAAKEYFKEYAVFNLPDEQ